MAVVKEDEHAGEEDGVAGEFDEVGAVGAGVEAFGVDKGVEGAVFGDDV